MNLAGETVASPSFVIARLVLYTCKSKNLQFRTVSPNWMSHFDSKFSGDNVFRWKIPMSICNTFHQASISVKQCTTSWGTNCHESPRGKAIDCRMSWSNILFCSWNIIYSLKSRWIIATTGQKTLRFMTRQEHKLSRTLPFPDISRGNKPLGGRVSGISSSLQNPAED